MIEGIPGKPFAARRHASRRVRTATVGKLGTARIGPDLHSRIYLGDRGALVVGEHRPSGTSSGRITDHSYPDWTMRLLDTTSASLRTVLDELLPGGLFMRRT